MSNICVYAHRGVRLETVENSMSAFKKAVKVGVRWNRTRSSISADGVPL